MLGGAVGAPHVAGVGCLGSVCCDLMFLGGIGTNKLAPETLAKGLAGAHFGEKDQMKLKNGTVG